jgi:hypothetical protein
VYDRPHHDKAKDTATGHDHHMSGVCAHLFRQHS